MRFLFGAKCYLSGPIQYCEDLLWRNKPLKVLKERFSINVFDPFADEKQKFGDQIAVAKKNKDIDTIVKIAKGFVRKDLGMVDRSDFIIAYVPKNVPTVGTVHEIIVSNDSKKPTLLVSDTDITNIPVWYFGFINKNYFFNNWEDLYDYLQEVDDGKHKDDDKWHLACNII